MNQIKSHFILLGTMVLIGCGSSKPQVTVDASTIVPEVVKEEKAPNPEGLRHFMDGQLLMNQGDFAMAIIEFQQALNLDPNVGAIHTAIAECYWNLGKPELSEKHLTMALKADPNDEQALQMVADQLIIQKKYDAAQGPFESLHKLNPEDTRYIIALAELQKVKQNYAEAMNLYLKAYELEPDRFELLETAGRFAIRVGDEKKAKNIFKDLTISNPNESHYLGLYIDLVSRLKLFDEGETLIHELDQKYGPAPERNAQLGLLLYRKGDIKQATDLLESSIEQAPKNPNYYFSLFDIYMDNQKIKKAAELGDKLIANFPEDWRGYYSRSLVFMDQKNPQAVIDLLAPVADPFQKVFSIHYLLGLSHNQLKQYPSAEKYYTHALTLRPESKNIMHSLAILYDEIDQFDKSDKIYLKLIDADSSDSQAFNNYAYSLVERNVELNRALNFAKKAIALEPENASYLDTIGWIYFKLDDLKKAKSYLEASVKIADDNAVVLEHLGDVFMKANQPLDAKEFYKRALELDSDNERLKDKVSLE